jgi:hypothetical protein
VSLDGAAWSLCTVGSSHLEYVRDNTLRLLSFLISDLREVNRIKRPGFSVRSHRTFLWSPAFCPHIMMS